MATTQIYIDGDGEAHRKVVDLIKKSEIIALYQCAKLYIEEFLTNPGQPSKRGSVRRGQEKKGAEAPFKLLIYKVF